MTFDVRAESQRARDASHVLAAASTAQKNAALTRLATQLDVQRDRIRAENEADVRGAEERGLTGAMVDRLRLTNEQIDAMIRGVLEVAALPDPVGRIDQVTRRDNGLEVGRMRIPLGVVAMVYESRPNVTIDAAALTLKSGNAVVLKGGSEAISSNRVLVELLRDALQFAGLPPGTVGFIDTTDRAAVGELLTLSELVDLVIPRGGEGLIRFVTGASKIPVIQHYKGVCHLFVDRAADLDMAARVVTNSKAQRTGVCNALEAVLVDAPVAQAFWAVAGPMLQEASVQVRGDEATRAALPWATPASDADWGEEFLDLILAARVVDGLDAAVAHIQRYGSGHTDGILTNDLGRSREFVRRVNSSCVVVNASTRFNDGGQLGLGAEIGISTSKLHAYGPMGLEELTTRKFVVMGEGQIRT